jgi:hypothetical protein
MLGVFRMLFDGSARPSKSSAARRANGIFRENLSQCIRELLIKCRNLGATGHVFIAFPEAQDRTLYRLRFGPGQWFAEFVATFGLLLTILGCVARTPATTTIRYQALHHVGVLVHGVNFVCQSSRRDCSFVLGYVRRDRRECHLVSVVRARAANDA